MPHFSVAGADRKTGKNKTIAIEAQSSQQAADLAMDRGLVVAKVAKAKPAEPTAAAVTPMPRSQYRVEVICEGWLGTLLLGGSKLNTAKMQAMMNKLAAEHWEVHFMVVEQRRLLLFWRREAAIVTFRRGS